MLSELPADALPARRLDALRDEIDAFPAGAQARGRTYAEQGRVVGLRVDRSRVEANVRGSRVYAASWWWVEGRWDHTCSCPIGEFCKHAFAVAAIVLDGGERSEPGLGPLTRLRDGRALWERQAALDELLAGTPEPSLTPYAPPLEELLREADPDTRCWRVADAIAREAAGWVPAELQPYLRRADLAERFRDRERVATVGALLDWARRRGSHPPRRVRLIFELARAADGAAQLTFQVRLTTPRVHDAPRTLAQLHGLRTECLRDAGLFPPEQVALIGWVADLAQPAAAEWNGTRLATARAAALVERAAGAGVAEWTHALDAELAARAGIVPGARLQLGGEDVVIEPVCVEGDGEVQIDLQARWRDGRARSLSDAVYVAGDEPTTGRGSVFIADGVLWLVSDEPPRALRERFATLGPLPVPRAERAALVGALAEGFPHLRTTVAAHTRIHAVSTSVTLDLRPDDWLQVRAFASSGPLPWHPGVGRPDAGVLFELTPERGWVRTTAVSGDGRAPAESYAPLLSAAVPGVASAVETEAVAPPAQVWLELPDPDAVAPLTAWIQSLPMASAPRVGFAEDGAPGWWTRVNRRALETLADVWERRPSGVTYFGTPRVRRLLGDTRVGAPRLRLRVSGVDWLRVSAAWEAEGGRLSEAELAALRTASGRFVRLDNGWVRRDVVEEHDEAAQILAELGIALDEGEQRLGVWQLAGASAAGLAHLAQLGADPESLAAVAALRGHIAAFTGISPVPIPSGLTATLRPYQRQGLDFLAYTSRLGIGAVLADDMGLGKTVQALAWLLHLRQQQPEFGPALVVCPASVVHNWAREAARFAPGLRVLLLTSGRERHALREKIPAHDLVVTTYALLRRDSEEWRRMPLGAAILDEAQFIKNPDAAVTRAALALDARHRLALTGTPLENRALDLWSIMAFVNPGYLGGRAAFARRVDQPDVPEHVRLLLAAKMRPVLLRRTKAAVAPELPPRIEERLDCELTTAQRQLYLAELKKSRALLARISEAPDRFNRERLNILAALTRLRQICCHPALAGGRADLESGKFTALFELLDPLLAEGHKVLLFSQFVQCLTLLRGALQARAVKYHQLTGATTKRERVVTAFQDDPDPCVFLISLKAGGTGLNLTAASYVVLFDPWWNPAVEAQAIDRTHRIGQDRTVIAYRMLARGTIEERIWELQQRKAALARDVLGEGGFARTLTREDLAYLLADVTG
jgi:superfamily II DNA or RNA helicase